MSVCVCVCCSGPDTPETIELEIKVNSNSKEGLILWQGVESVNGASHFRKMHASKKVSTSPKHLELGDQGKGKDFISLGLQNGHFVFSYQLGSGESQISPESPSTMADGTKVTAV
ncbi:basement membrane-specific heparan sulfate proteoglycan core protein-like, partial [Oncorhynchus masou masou]|uniref:basement membrane-specific heparan sulfate proteoglycan core protein-like n=1 Tax=Oncorhynchus masou masou TaxID=90313 RepID=UPI0031831B33